VARVRWLGIKYLKFGVEDVVMLSMDFVSDEHRAIFGGLAVFVAGFLSVIAYLIVDFGMGLSSEVASVLVYVVAGFIALNAIPLYVAGLYQAAVAVSNKT